MKSLLVGIVGIVGCSASAPLQPTGAPEIVRPWQAPVAGGKGFVAPRAAPPVPPMSLTASDGSGLRLVGLDVEAEVDDPVALTELDLSFQNPHAKVVEGTFEIALPPGAMVTRFAMKIAGAWQEGEVVARSKGREVYESFLHEKRDPALLEQEVGNRFTARVFPIAASGNVELKLSYLQTFAEPELAYRLPLRGLPKIDNRAVSVTVRHKDGSTKTTEEAESSQRPRTDLVVPRDGESDAAWRMDRHAIARVTIPASFGGENEPPAAVLVLFDTSASRASQFAAKAEKLTQLAAELAARVGPQLKLTVIPFDQALGRAVFDGPAGDYNDSKATRALVHRRALGASNLSRALRGAAKVGADRVVLVTDGMITAGVTEAAELGKRVAALAGAGVKRVDVIAGMDRRDDAVLRAIVKSDLPRAGVVIDAGLPAPQIAQRILRPTAPPIAVRIGGTTRVWPERLEGMQAGTAALVFAELPRRANTLTVELEPVGGKLVTRKLKLAKTSNPVFDRAFVRSDVEAQLDAMTRLPSKDRIARQRRLTKLSVDNRILNQLTALLVLETDSDYARFDIDRDAAGRDVLVFEDEAAQGTRRTKRSSGRRVVRARPGPATTNSGRQVSMEEFRNIPVGSGTSRDFTQVVENSATAGGDSAGISLQGTTSAESRFAAAEARRSSKVTLKATRVRGGMSKKHARALGRVNAASLEACHRAALATSPAIKGKLTIEFRTRQRRVVDARLTKDTALAPAAMKRCVLKAVTRWWFGSATDPDSRIRLTFAFKPVAGASFIAAPPRSARRPQDALPNPGLGDGYTGKLGEVMAQLRDGKHRRAAEIAWAWRDAAPHDVMALVAVGEVAEAFRDKRLAARVYGSIAELHPSKAPMRRFAAGRLERLGRSGLAYAVENFREAKRQRPDHPSSHRGLAWALARKGRFAEAFDALADGFDRSYPAGRFNSTPAALGEELGVLAAAWLRAKPAMRTSIELRLADLGISAATEPSLRFVLTWETDANDVDLHIVDVLGEHASYERPALSSGGLLLADVTTGFGPESFVIPGKPTAYPYDLQIHYYSQGPMGYGMGQVQVIHHDGTGNLEIETLPFVAMRDDAWVHLGKVRSPKFPSG